MAKGHRINESVRMGPISIFTLVVILCVAVMAVLCFTTAHASLTVAQRQATFATDNYANETSGQEFVAAVDEVLYSVQSAGDSADLRQEAMLALKKKGDDLAPSATVEFGSDTVSADFLLSSSRRLYVELTIEKDGTYRVTQWKQTTRQDKLEEDDQLLLVTD